MACYLMNFFSQVHERPKCDTHGRFCLIFGSIAILTNSSTLISKIIVASSILVLRWCLGASNYDVTLQIRNFLFLNNFKFNKPRKSVKALIVYAKNNSKNFWRVLRCFYEYSCRHVTMTTPSYGKFALSQV